jgi:uncharacterized repeat protein (TIGR03803 family)
MRRSVLSAVPSGGNWTETVIYSFFRGRGFARNPSGGFIVDGPNRLFGASSAGGNGLGTLFRLDATAKGWNQSILYRFSGDPDGKAPLGRLAKGPEDTWFGVTKSGGMNHDGTVFALEQTKLGWQERILYNFDRSSAWDPQAGPVADSQGHVYGTTAGGGTGNNGTVYEVIP